MSAAPESAWEAIDRICLLDDVGGTGRVAELQKLYQAARSRAGGPLCAAAARRLQGVLRPGATVLLLTGAGAPPSLPKGETDGPLGAAVLARALALAFEVRSFVVAEARFREPILATLDALAESSRDPTWRHAVRYLPFEARRGPAGKAAAVLWRRTQPSAVISIERLGPNSLGITHDAMGRDVTAAHAAVESLISLARKRRVLTIAVGDRGNELGFGAIISRSGIPSLARPCRCPCKSSIQCAVSTELVLVSSVSNWGAYAVAAALAICVGNARLLHRPLDESRMLRSCVLAGARDGLTGRRGLTVDGLPLRTQRAVIGLLSEVLRRMKCGEGR